MKIHRKRNKSLGLAELVDIALGRMVEEGIYTISGISVSMIGNLRSYSKTGHNNVYAQLKKIENKIKIN